MKQQNKPFYDIQTFGQGLPPAIISFVQLAIRMLNKIVMPVFWAKVRVQTKPSTNKISGPLLIIANHKSYYDPLLIAQSLPWLSEAYPLRFITKDQLFENPVSNLVFRAMGSFPTYYGAGIDKSLQTPYEILTEGGTVVFFPEGKCIRQEELGEGKVGAATLALKIPDLQILPIAIHSSYKIGFFKKPKIEIIVGEPFWLKDKVELSQATPDSVTALFMNQIGNLYFQK
jgi:1-acyl-sn-glycerol-3-phosphate acyltransferase